MDIDLIVLRRWLLYNQNVNEMPIAVIIILTMTILFRKKSWKKCGLAFLRTFIIYIFIRYLFYLAIFRLPPGSEWKIFSMDLLKRSIHHSFYIMINLFLWRLIMAFFYRFLPNRHAFVAVVSIAFVLFTLFYMFILIYEERIFSPLLYRILNLLPDIWY